MHENTSPFGKNSPRDLAGTEAGRSVRLSYSLALFATRLPSAPGPFDYLWEPAQTLNIL